jgi:putative acetyltransferase
LIEIREEFPTDHDAVDAVVEAAFGRREEADLVKALRAEECIVLNLVAEAHGCIVGHISFTELPIDTGKRILRGAALAPVSIHPDWQRRGLGSALIQRGLLMLKDRGVSVVAVLGEVGYYSRFGFSSELGARLDSPFPVPEFQALALTHGIFDESSGKAGKVRYAKAFGLG